MKGTTYKKNFILKKSPRKNKRFRIVMSDSMYHDFGQKEGKTFIDGRTQKEKVNNRVLRLLITFLKKTRIYSSIPNYLYYIYIIIK